MGEDQELEKALAEFLASKEADAFAENNYNEPMRCMEHGFKVGWEQRSEISPFERFGRFLADDHDDEKSRKPVGEFPEDEARKKVEEIGMTNGMDWFANAMAAARWAWTEALSTESKGGGG